MFLQSDDLGFPMVSIPEIDLSVSLLPVTKFQFERFIAHENQYSDSWYDKVLAINPRCSWRKINQSNRENLFMTFRIMKGTRVDTHRLLALDGHAAAKSIIDTFVAQIKPNNWAELSLLKGGLMEWVRNGEVFGGFGVPRAQFLPNAFNPEIQRPARPLPAERSRYFGFRLIQRGCLVDKRTSWES
jgi:hypothetical protein